MSNAVQHAFGAGEIAPVLYSRVDSQKYSSGCKTLRNNIITRSGALANRCGTTFAGEVKDSTKTVRLIPFEFSNTQSYVLEFGDQYVRFYQNGNQILEYPTSISGITNNNPGVITDTAHGYLTGDEIFINGIIGTTQLNDRNFKVVKLSADTYSLLYMDGNVVDTTSFGAYSSGGTAQRVYTVATIYPYTVLPDIKFVQSADVMTFVHPNYPPQQLSRTATIANGLNVWTWNTLLFNPVTIGPINGSLASQNEVQVLAPADWTDSNPTSGNGYFNWNGNTIGSPLAYNASLASVNTALQALSGLSGLIVTGDDPPFPGPNDTFFNFAGGEANTKQPLIRWVNAVGHAFFNGANQTNPLIRELQVGGTISLPSGPNTFKYKFTAIDKITGEESLPGINGSVSITAITTGTTSCVITAASHGLTSGDEVLILLTGVTQIDNNRYIVSVLDANTFLLVGVDATLFTPYVSGGSLSYTFLTAANVAIPTASVPLKIIPGAVGSNVSLINAYKQINGVYGFIGSCNPGQQFPDTNIPPDTTQQPPQFTTLFSTPNNYPSVVAYYQQRLCFANTINQPMWFWASKVGKFTNFTTAQPGVPSADDDAVIFELASDKVDPIVNMADPGNLIILTQNYERAVLGNNTGGQYGTLTPTAINVAIQSAHGGASLRPLIVQGSLIYLQARQSILRDLLFHFEEDKYKGNDLTTFATHLFDTFTITDMDYQQIPNTQLWCIRSDGQLLSCTYNREQDILAWSHHDTSGTFENVCVIPENNTDVLYVVANRLVLNSQGVVRNARYVERMVPRTVEITSVPEMTFMDCAGIFDGSNPQNAGTRPGQSDLVLTGGYATAASNSALNVSNPTKITVRCWIKMSSNNPNNGIATRASLAPDFGDWSLLVTNRQVRFRVNQTGAELISTPISINNWHFVEANYDSSAPAMRLFIDGALVASRTDYSTVITNHSNKLVIGDYYDTSGNYTFQGELSEFEFCANFIRNTSAYTPPTVITVDSHSTVVYHMTDGFGSTMADSSGNSINATTIGNANLGPATMTATSAGVWTDTGQLTLTCSESYFTSAMVGDDIRTNLSNGQVLIFKIIHFTSSTVVKVIANMTVPAAYQSTAFSVWSRGTANIGGLWFLEDHAVSVLGDGYVVASPYNENYNKTVGVTIVHNGAITLSQNFSYVIVGCPFVSDFKSLDVDVVGYAVFMGKTAMNKFKNISELTSQVVQSRGGFYGSATPETESANSTNDPLFKLYEMKPRDFTTNPYLPPYLTTDNIRMNIQGGWDIHGNVFMRQVDPLPLCLSAIAFAGNIPLRDNEQTTPQGGLPK